MPKMGTQSPAAKGKSPSSKGKVLVALVLLGLTVIAVYWFYLRCTSLQECMKKRQDLHQEMTRSMPQVPALVPLAPSNGGCAKDTEACNAEIAQWNKLLSEHRVNAGCTGYHTCLSQRTEVHRRLSAYEPGLAPLTAIPQTGDCTRSWSPRPRSHPNVTPAHAPRS